MSALGFDTSNYTTSVAWTDGDTDKSERRLLYVKSGERGIRQSDGVFQHMKLMPELFGKLSEKIDMNSVSAVGISARPRNVEGSYMPVFLAGAGYGKVVADALRLPLYEFSHQDGHIMAGIYSCGAFGLLDKDFISVHISGGTTEILKSRYIGQSFENEIIGGTKDISAGQFIDRVGVKLGLSFPAGKALEQMAMGADHSVKLPVSTDGSFMSFSGVETKASRMADTVDSAALALGVLETVRDALVKSINSAIKETKTHNILIVGGVASNGIIRKGLTERLDGTIHFAAPEYSTDNAVGIAYLAHLADKEA
ncbi:MAG: DNA-binding protein [Oscillospiraceae bacterium]|nr:DNA-binding protein [Oscillospiraceae bacterium]